jgi:hypothetical protein
MLVYRVREELPWQVKKLYRGLLLHSAGWNDGLSTKDLVALKRS